MDKEFWSTQDVAEFLGVPISTLRYWAWQGSGPPAYRLGRNLRFKPAEVRAWVDSKATATPRTPRPRDLSTR